ncbi:hypothetical protein BGW38_007509 [Lunasporangiospora selenospora]|uniref:Methyltransferase domain-containing protein n=1 Tax=Lunasporangiospora selenospora TaxID=979761 RepID=A0A9P6G0L7_9FUNG|nr:hypothetical protein BGW38_007509 [Lunasporangiospora selenospora]
MPSITPSPSELPLLTTIASLDQATVKFFQNQYPDYDEHASEFPLWIDGVDTTYAPFIPTSVRRVLLALEMARISPTDKVLDVGSGDGRFCYAAVKLFGAQAALGIECEQDLVDKSTELATDLVQEGRVSFQVADLATWRDMASMQSKEWTVIIVYLSPEGGDDLCQWIQQEFKRGVRIVALVFDMKHLDGLHCSFEDSQEGIWIYEKPKN